MTVEELIQGVNIALGVATVETCSYYAACSRPGCITIDLLLGAVASALLGCAPTAPTPAITPRITATVRLTPTPTAAADVLAALMENRALWARIGAVRYRMLERLRCYCHFDHPHLVAIEVVDNRIVSIRDVWTGTEVVDPPANTYRTVDGIFSLIEEAITIGADGISVRYDEYAGVPIDTYTDYHRTRFDEERGFSISDMTIWTE